MKSISATICSMCLLIIANACERPKAPDFRLENKIETPISTEQVYQFLGGEKALIDTTKKELDSLFSVNDKGLVSLNKKENIDFKSFNNVFPTIDVNPTDISARVGELELGTFSLESENVAEISFRDVLGRNSAGITKGTPLPDQVNRRITDIEFKSKYFESATIKEGKLVMTVENRLGFDIDNYKVEIYSGNRSLGTVQFPDGPGLGYGEVKTGELPVGGKRLENINFTMIVSWTDAKMQTNSPGPLSINDVGGKNIKASEVEAYVPVQRFAVHGIAEIDSAKNLDFRFTQPDHYVELKSGQLRVLNINNNMDLDLDTLQVSFPDIRKPPYMPGDSLVVMFKGDSRILANTNNSIEKAIPLKDLRIYAEGQALDYNVYAVTGSPEEGKEGTLRTIQEDDSVTANIELETVNIREVYGVIEPRDVLINTDKASNGTGTIDLFNDNEAEIINLGEQRSFLKQITGLEFAEPLLSFQYKTNLGVETTIYAAIAGVNANGEITYLSGKPGSKHHVENLDKFEQFQTNGGKFSSDKLIKFKLNKSEDGSVIGGANNFTTKTTNVDEFISNLPTEVRFVGLAALNEDPVDPAGIIKSPVKLNPSIGIGLPLHLSAKTSTLSDTLDVNLKDLPKETDNHFISEATFIIDYTNNLPFRIELSLSMLDGDLKQITQVPLPEENPTTFRGASINPNTKFVESGSNGEVAITLNEEQFSKLYKTRYMVINIAFNTTKQEEVKVRAEDSISMSLQLNVTIESDIE